MIASRGVNLNGTTIVTAKDLFVFNFLHMNTSLPSVAMGGMEKLSISFEPKNVCWKVFHVGGMLSDWKTP